MKHNRIYHYFGWLALSTLLLTTACAGISDLDVEKPKVSGPNTVTFTIQPQTMTGGMRAAGDIDTRNTVISRGDSANVLIYAVYKKTENDTYEVDPKFGKGDLTKDKKFTNDGTSLLGTGQTAIKVENFPITLQFLIEDDGKYRVAFWAQSGETEAYDTKDLTKVEVKYSKTVDGKQVNFLNNTENRDAFCAFSGEISASTKDMQTVTLTRPLAQINVGTAGWDYEGAAVLRPGSVSYNQSTMTLKGVARYYNVLKGETLKQSELTSEDGKDTTDVTFGYYRLPAFINVNEGEWKEPKIVPYYHKVSPDATDSTRIEEFLTVDLNKNNEIEPYKGWTVYNEYRKTNDFIETGKLPDTEQFKYLSMCYVLVPESSNTTSNIEHSGKNGNEIDGEDEGEDIGSTVVDVEFTFKGVERTDDGDGFGEDISFQQKYQVNNVPVKKNWRTNLLSQNIFTYSTTFKIDVVPQYMGNFNDDGTISGSWPKNHVIPNEGATYYSVDFSGGKDNVVYKSNDEDNAASFFTYSDLYGSNRYGKWNYVSERTGSHSGENGVGLKLSGAQQVSFETDSFAVVIVVCSEKTTNKEDKAPNGNADSVRGICFDGKDYPLSEEVKNPNNNSGVYVYTIDGVEPGKHVITQGKTVTSDVSVNETGLFYVEVIYGELQLDGIDPDENFEYENPDE